LIQPVAGWEGVSSAIKEIRECHAETWSFFHGLFEELNSFGKSLEGQKDHLLETIRPGESNPPAVAAAFDERLNQLLAERQAEHEELRESREAVREQVAHLSTVAVELAAAQKDFQANFQRICEEIVRSRETRAAEPSSAPVGGEGNAELERKLTDLERQHAALEQDRAVLEKELEGVRNRAADLAESLAEQKRQVTQQQTQGNVELQHIRAMLETIARQNREIELSPAPAEPAPPPAAKPAPSAAAAADPVLGSVLAQFEMLQQDRARRRA
jgi:chromosome segregation ATPase